MARMLVPKLTQNGFFALHDQGTAYASYLLLISLGILSPTKQVKRAKLD